MKYSYGKVGSHLANQSQDKITMWIPEEGMFLVSLLLMLVLAVSYLCILLVECQLFRI